MDSPTPNVSTVAPAHPVRIDIHAPEAPAPARVAVADEGDVVVMRFPRGKIDGHAVREMYEATVSAIDHQNMRLLVDLTGLDSINSGGMGMLVTMKKRCLSSGAQLHIAVPNDLIMGQFEIMRLNIVLNLFPSLAAAVAAFK